MKRAIFVGLVCAAAGGMVVRAAGADPWYIPMGEGVPGGFNHIQALMRLPDRFDEPAISLFWAYEAPDNVDDAAALWAETYNNTVFVAADGPSLGDYTLVFDMWMPGQPPPGALFHFQAYLDNELVDNADCIYVGPGHLDWNVVAGTWQQDEPLPEPEWIIGDADLDGDVDFADYQLLQAGYGTGTTWFEGDFDEDGDVDFADYQLQQANYGYGVHAPEPATVGLVAFGAGGLLLLRKRMRKGK